MIFEHAYTIILVFVLLVAYSLGFFFGRTTKHEKLANALERCVSQRAREAHTSDELRIAVVSGLIVLQKLSIPGGATRAEVDYAKDKLSSVLTWPWGDARCSACIHGPATECSFLRVCSPGPASHFYPKAKRDEARG